MQRLGRVSHATKRGLVLRVEEAPREGTLVYDEARRRVGGVIDIFGPTGMPYICVRPAAGVKVNLTSLVGKELYIMGEERGAGRKGAKVPGMRKRKARA